MLRQDDHRVRVTTALLGSVAAKNDVLSTLGGLLLKDSLCRGLLCA